MRLLLGGLYLLKYRAVELYDFENNILEFIIDSTAKKLFYHHCMSIVENKFNEWL